MREHSDMPGCSWSISNAWSFGSSGSSFPASVGNLSGSSGVLSPASSSNEYYSPPPQSPSLSPFDLNFLKRFFPYQEGAEVRYNKITRHVLGERFIILRKKAEHDRETSLANKFNALSLKEQEELSNLSPSPYFEPVAGRYRWRGGDRSAALKKARESRARESDNDSVLGYPTPFNQLSAVVEEEIATRRRLPTRSDSFHSVSSTLNDSE